MPVTMNPGKRARECREKGKPTAKRGRKATGLPIAGRWPDCRTDERMYPKTTNGPSPKRPSSPSDGSSRWV